MELPILCIESSTEVCSVALFDQTKLIHLEEADDVNRHAELLAILIDKTMKTTGLTFDQLRAVAVSNGPGSYTSLRVGLSTAKGICLGSGKPLITIPSDRVLIRGQLAAAEVLGASHVIAMIDARRMEAYCTIYQIANKSYTLPTPVIFGKDSFHELAGASSIGVCGNGSEKWCRFIQSPLYYQLAKKTSASFMGEIVYERFIQGSFDDLARVSPEYIKPPNITLSKKNFGIH